MTKPAKEKSLFAQTHELTKMMKELKKISLKAIKVLEKALDSEDEKLAVQAAEKTLKFYSDAAKEIRTDQVNGILIEMKMGLVGQGTTVPDDNTPVLDFDNLTPEFRKSAEEAEDVVVVDLSDVNKIGG